MAIPTSSRLRGGRRRLHCLPGLHEAGQAGVHPARPAGVSGQQGPPVVALDQHDHGGGQPGKGEEATAGQRRARSPGESAVSMTAATAKPVAAGPLDQLYGAAGRGPGWLVDVPNSRMRSTKGTVSVRSASTSPLSASTAQQCRPPIVPTKRNSVRTGSGEPRDRFPERHLDAPDTTTNGGPADGPRR